MAEINYWGTDEGVRRQKEFEAMIPEPWQRILQTYQFVNGEEYRMHFGDAYEFRKVENGLESRAMKLYWDWDQDNPRWRLLVGKRYEIKDDKIHKVLESDIYKFKGFRKARDKALKIMHDA